MTLPQFANSERWLELFKWYKLSLYASVSIEGSIENAVLRAGVSREITTAQIFSANEALESFANCLQKTTRAVSIREGIIAVHVTSSSLGQFIQDHEQAIIDRIKRQEPEARINHLRTILINTEASTV